MMDEPLASSLEERRFLGRFYDVNTATWRHPDGSGGAMPDEIRCEVMLHADGGDGSFIRAFYHVWRWKAQATAGSGSTP